MGKKCARANKEMDIYGTNVFCPKCKSPAFRNESIEEIEKKYPDNLKMQIELKRIWKCSNPECFHIWQISMPELLKAFSRKMKKGFTSEDNKRAEETKQKIKEIKENEKTKTR